MPDKTKLFVFKNYFNSDWSNCVNNDKPDNFGVHFCNECSIASVNTVVFVCLTWSVISTILGQRPCMLN